MTMTGLTFLATELNGKRLELLKELVPGMRRIGVLANPLHPGRELEQGVVELMLLRCHVTARS